jgi:hypothetical protein
MPVKGSCYPLNPTNEGYEGRTVGYREVAVEKSACPQFRYCGACDSRFYASFHFRYPLQLGF